MERKTNEQEQDATTRSWIVGPASTYYVEDAQTVSADRRHDATELGFGCYRTNTHLEVA